MLFVNQRVGGEMRVSIPTERFGFDGRFARGRSEEGAALRRRKERGDLVHFGARVRQSPEFKAALGRGSTGHRGLVITIDWITERDNPFRFGCVVLLERAQRG